MPVNLAVTNPDGLKAYARPCAWDSSDPIESFVVGPLPKCATFEQISGMAVTMTCADGIAYDWILVRDNQYLVPGSFANNAVCDGAQWVVGGAANVVPEQCAP